MSRSDEAAKLSALLVGLRAQIESTIQAGKLAELGPQEVTNLLSSAVKLYARAVEDAEQNIAVSDGSVSTTEAMVVACALLRSQDMNPFDLALWFSRTERKAH
jgi:hypothetical protein